MGEQRAGVLFDVDGTLVDTSYLHTLAWSRALRDVGERASMNAIHRLVGMGGDQLVPRLLGRQVPEANERRILRYGELLDEVTAFPGAAEALRRVHEAGLVVVLATSSPGDEVDNARRAIGGDQWVDAVTTKDDVDRSKPAPDLIETATKAGGLDPGHVLTVGDSVWDVEAARAAGVGCVGVETGGFSRHELSEAGALHVYRDIGELAAQVHTGPLALLAVSSPGPRRPGGTP